MVAKQSTITVTDYKEDEHEALDFSELIYGELNSYRIWFYNSFSLDGSSNLNVVMVKQVWIPSFWILTILGYRW